MGWLFGWETKEALVKHLTSPESFGAGTSILKSTVKGNILWLLVNTPTRGKVIAIALLQGTKVRGSELRWGYKDFDESAGPNEVNVPLAWLDEAPLPDSPYAAGWRDKVRAYHAEQKVKSARRKSLQVGSVVILRPGTTFGGAPLEKAVIQTLKPLVVSVLGPYEGQRARLRPGLIASVEVSA